MYLKERYESVPKEQLKDFEAFSESFSKIEKNGLTFFDSEGDLPVLVMIPGTTGDAYVFWEYIGKLNEKYRVLVFDYPKEGDLNDFVGNIHKTVMEIAEYFCVLGFSTGGVIAQKMAYTYKDQVAKMILIHSYTKASDVPKSVLKVHTKSLDRLIKSLGSIRYRSMQKNFAKNLKRSVERSELVNKEFNGALYNDILMNTERKQMKLNYGLILDFWNEEGLMKNVITCPVLLIESEADQDVKTEDRTDLRVLYPNKKILTLKGTTSFSLVKNFNKISDEILKL